jgi:hypothetical protein
MQCVRRSILCYGLECYPDGAPGISSNHRSYNGLQPSCVFEADGTLVACFQSGTSHAGTGAIGVLRRSHDNGATWDDCALDTQMIYQASAPDRNFLQHVVILKHGAHAGRMLAIGATEYVSTDDHVEPYIVWSDDRITWHQVALPRIESYYTQGESFCELPSGRLLASVYTRRLGSSGARSYCIYSDDGGVTWQTFEDYPLHPDPVTGDPGVIASQALFVTEYKEPYIGLLGDGRLMCLIRSDDSIQITYKAFSSDGGATWTGLATAFNAWNFPAWVSLSDGTVVCTSRRQTLAASDGNDCSIMVTSSDFGATWSTPINLYDPTIGTGASEGCTPIEMPDGRIGVIHASAPPGAIFNRCRLEFSVWTSSPLTSGEYGRFDLDQNVEHPSKDLTDGSGNNTVVAWFCVEDLRESAIIHGTVPTRWRNMQGDSRYDLIPGPNGAFTFSDGSDMTSPNGLVGGIGSMTNPTGNKSMIAANDQRDRPILLAQPLCVILVCDAGTTGSTLMIWDDPSGTSFQYQGGNGKLFLHTGGANQFHTPSSFPPGKTVLTSIFNGASSSIRQNGAALPVSSGGPLSGATTITGFRIQGTGSPNGFLRSIRKIVLAQISDLTKIAAYEAKLVARHRIHG